MSDEPNVIDERWTIGPWLASGLTEGEPPHLQHGDTRGHVSLHVVWADAERTTPMAVEDWDGCTAIVAGPEG